MSDKNFPGPSINKTIDEDPMIVKIPLEYMGFASRKSAFNVLGNDPTSQDPSQPSAPEMTIKHVGNK